MAGTIQELMDEIKSKISDLVTLEIITAVGEVKFAADPDDSTKVSAVIDTQTPAKAILTKINLLDGDIRTVLDPAFVTGDYKDLQAFHAEREKEGHAIVKANLAALKALFDLAKSLKDE